MTTDDLEARVGPYRVRDHGGRLEVLDAAGLCVWLGLSEPALRVAILGPSQVGEVAVERRARRAGDIKRPRRSRPWEVEVRDRAGLPIGRRLRFREEAQARAMASRIERFAGSPAAF